MTESEIMKALECCRDNDNNLNMEKCFDECPYKGECAGKFMKDALDLINRKNAEIEELQHEKTELQHKIEKLNFENLQMVASIKGLEARAIKEVVGIVKFKVEEPWLYGKNAICRILDQIAKEMGVEL